MWHLWQSVLMLISEAVSTSVPLAVPFAGGAVLNIEYRPSSVSLAQMEEMVAQAEEAANAQREEAEQRKAPITDAERLKRLRERLNNAKKQLADNILGVVTMWDLRATEEDTEPVPLTIEGLTIVPTNVFTEIIKAIRAHQAGDDDAK